MGIWGLESDRNLVGPRHSSDDYYLAAQTLARYAHADLPEMAWAWLAQTLASALPPTSSAAAAPPPGREPVSALLATSVRPPTATALLTVMRDADAADLQSLLLLPWSRTDYGVGDELYDYSHQQIIHVSEGGACIVDLSGLVRVKPNELLQVGLTNGVTYDRRANCINLVVWLWDTYRDVGSAQSFNAAAAAWRYLSEVAGMPHAKLMREIKSLLL